MSLFGSSAPTQTGFGAFGQPQPQQQQQQQQPTSLFGSAPAQPAAGGSIFGSTTPAAGANTGTTGGLFGAQQQQQQQQQQTQPAAGGLFGSTAGANAGQTGTGGLFGSTNTQQQQQPAAGGLFGAAGTQQQQQQPATGGGLFGNTGTTQPAAGGLFGSTQSATGGGLFGNAATPTTAPTTGGLFGSAPATQSATTGGLFGAAASTGNTGGLFGGAASLATPTAPTGGLFGNAAAQQPAQGTTSLFGSTSTTPAPSLFGQQPKPAGSLFGGLGASTLGQSTLGVSTLGQPSLSQSILGQSTLGQSMLGVSALGAPARTNSLLGTRGTLIPAPSLATGDPAAQASQLAARIEAIYQAWNAQSPNCRFQHYFYNLVDPATVSRYGRPPNAYDEMAWQKAVAENPDPSCLVPVLAVGFDDLAQRVEAQTQQSAAHTQALEDLRKRLAALHTAHTTTSAPRLVRATQAQAQIAHRLRALVQHLHLLIPALRASALRPEEEALRAALDALDEEIRGARGGSGFGSMGRLRTRLNELWALLGAVAAARERESRGGAAKVGWKVVDEDGLRELAGVLGEQQAGLAHLTKVLQKDLRDLSVIEGREVRDENGHIKEGGLGASIVGR